MTSWTTAPHRTTRGRAGDIIRDYEWKSPLEMMRKYVGEFIGEAAPRWAADTMAELQRRPVDLLVVDFAVPAALIPAEQLGIPRVFVMPGIWMLPTKGIPPFGLGLLPPAGPIGALRDTVLRWLVRRAFSVATAPINKTRHAYGLAPVRGVHEQILRANEIHVLTSPVFDFTSPAMPPNVRYTGPELDDPSWVGSWQSPWPAADTRPLVLVGLSSTFQNQAVLLQRIVEALSTLDVRALLTLGGAIDASEVQGAPNVVVVPSAPHRLVLPHTSVLVTHCGHGTTLKGLAAGVPLVCVPMGRDQDDTAARVVHRGAGVRLKPTASVNLIRAAVREVLTNSRYREAAQSLARALAAREGCIDPILSLERLAASRAAGSAHG